MNVVAYTRIHLIKKNPLRWGVQHLYNYEMLFEVESKLFSSLSYIYPQIQIGVYSRAGTQRLYIRRTAVVPPMRVHVGGAVRAGGRLMANHLTQLGRAVRRILTYLCATLRRLNTKASVIHVVTVREYEKPAQRCTKDDTFHFHGHCLKLQ